MSNTWDSIQGIGHGTDEILYAVTRNGGDGVKLEAALLAELAQGFEARAVGGGIEFGRDHDHGFFGQRFAEGGKFAVDDFKRMDRVIFVRIAGINQMNKEPRALDMTEEADAEAGAFVRAFDEAGEIGDDKGAAEFGAVPAGAAVGVDDAEIGLERGEGIVGDLRTRGRDYGNQCGFSGVRKTDEADIREKF